jgi:predicted transcriptional regulator
MIVRVIKQYVKHNRVNNVGDEIGVTKEKAKGLIALGLVEDINAPKKVKKVEKVTPKKEVKKSKSKKK